MRHWMTATMTATVMAALTLALVPTDADAKRAGGARSSGMQRQAPDKPVQKAPADASPTTPSTAGAAAAAPAAAAAAAKAAPAAAARSKWMGPLMGLAAGLGLAALFSSLGMGETFSSIIMILLLAMVGFAAFRFFMSRRAKGNGASGAGPFAMAGAGAGAGTGAVASNSPSLPSGMARTAADDSRVQIGSALTPPLAVPGLNDGAAMHNAAAADTASTTHYLPADFDTQAFERIAKTIFLRLQVANDERNLDDLRAFTTPEMFAELRTDLLERGTATQNTDVVSVNATVMDFAEEGAQQIVSVRYVGVVREDAAAAATSFDEVWHLVKERDGGPAWRIAGIQQMG